MMDPTTYASPEEVNDPSLNRNIGKYQLTHIWGEVLFNNLDF